MMSRSSTHRNSTMKAETGVELRRGKRRRGKRRGTTQGLLWDSGKRGRLNIVRRDAFQNELKRLEEKATKGRGIAEKS